MEGKTLFNQSSERNTPHNFTAEVFAGDND